MKNFSGFIIAIFCLVAGFTAPACSAEMSAKDVYELKQKAMEKLDPNDFYKCITRDNAAVIKETKDPKATMILIKMTNSPVKYEIIKEVPGTDTTTIYLKGEAHMKASEGKVEAGYGKAVFKKEGRDWKCYSEEWQKNPWK
jgi:hypothetical protein